MMEGERGREDERWIELELEGEEERESNSAGHCHPVYSGMSGIDLQSSVNQNRPTNLAPIRIDL